MKRWLPVAAAVAIPGSGHVLLGRPARGLVFLFWMVIFGYITFHLTTETTSLLGRLSGGIGVWVISVLEAYRLARKRRKTAE